MSTPFSEVFDAFLSQINDDFYATASPEMVESDMIKLLNASIFHFKYPRVNIADKDDIVMQFNIDLTNAEIQVLATLMKQQWVKRRVDDINNIKQRFNEGDFNMTSQAAHLKTLIELRDVVKKEAKDAMDTYSRVQDFKPSPLFGELATAINPQKSTDTEEQVASSEEQM